MSKSVIDQLRSAEPVIERPKATPVPAPNRNEPLMLNGATFASSARKSVENAHGGASRRVGPGGLSPRTAETMRTMGAKMASMASKTAPVVATTGRVYRLTGTQAAELKSEATTAYMELAGALKASIRPTLSREGHSLAAQAIDRLYELSRIVIDMGGGNVVVEDNRLDFLHGAYEIAGKLRGIA